MITMMHMKVSINKTQKFHQKKEENLLFHILILAKCDVFLKHGFLIQLRVGIYNKISGPACS